MRLRFLPMRFSSESPASADLHGKPHHPASGTGPGIGKSVRETAHSAQPSPENGVPEDMASLVIDNPGLSPRRNSVPAPAAGGWTALNPARPQTGPQIGEDGEDEDRTVRTDAEIMLAV